MGAPLSFPGGQSLLTEVKHYIDIRSPALFIVSSQSGGTWADSSTDPAIKTQIVGLNALLERQAKAIEHALPSAQVVKLPRANHYVFRSNEADVLHETRAFLGRLR